MIKPIIQYSIIRKAAIGMMLAGATLGASASCNNSSKVSTDPIANEQVMSSAAASSLAAGATANTPNFEPNKLISKKLISMAENETEVTDAKDYIDKTFKKFGTYAGTWIAQTAINQSYYLDILEKFDKAESERLMALGQEPGHNLSREELKRGGFEEGITKTQAQARKDLFDLGEFVNFANDHFTSPVGFLATHASFVNEALANGIPSYEKCSAAVDKYVNSALENNWFDQDDMQKYKTGVNNYINNLQAATRNSVQGKANTIAYKIYLFEFMILEKYFTGTSSKIEHKKFDAKFLKYLQGEYSKQTNPQNF